MTALITVVLVVVIMNFSSLASGLQPLGETAFSIEGWGSLAGASLSTETQVSALSLGDDIVGTRH